MKRKHVIGILAPVDAGKTTLSESLLYLSGKIRKLGRVDNKDAFLDTYDLEKSRGITIFSKQAQFELSESEVILMDTPGHVDFSAEMERTLQILDYAILVVSGADGVQGHTKTLWKLLDVYDIPVFIFINKMDQPGTDRNRVLNQLKAQLSENITEFDLIDKTFYEALALCDEDLMDAFLEKDQIGDDLIKEAVMNRNVFPCYFGSALRLEGIDIFLEGLNLWTKEKIYPEAFSARIFKISRDEQGNRLTHLKVTGGNLKVKDLIKSQEWEEKINQIRVYSGSKFEAVSEVEAGCVCAVTGLSVSKAGECLGAEQTTYEPLLEPVLSYKIILPDGVDPRVMMPKLKLIEEEEPELKFIWIEALGEIQAKLMGAVQTEILHSQILERFNVNVEFGKGHIVYKETIVDRVLGVGHFEPLRHYAEVHVLIEHASGLHFENKCSDDDLAKHWQNQILSHLKEKTHRGVLTGSPLTDVKITLVAGRSHLKHTVGGDFREATYRAVRQGLMEAQSVLLEPYYQFQLEIPEKLVGRAMSDVEKMFGNCQLEHTDGVIAHLSGKAPVSTMTHYHMEVIAYSKGEGKLFTRFGGYDLCHNADEVVTQMGYDVERDRDNPSGSVFCTQGTGVYIPWNEVKSKMHIDLSYSEAYDLKANQENHLKIESQSQVRSASLQDVHMSLEEINQILDMTYNANKGKKDTWKKTRAYFFETSQPVVRRNEHLESYLLVDGYNIIFSWPELKELAAINMDAARSKLIDDLSNYQAIKKNHIIVVFDAYKVEGRRDEMTQMHHVFVVFTGEAQTADQYIEKFSHQNQLKYQITVATSDGLQQMIIRGAGSNLLSARELKEELEQTNQRIKELSQKFSGESKVQFEDVMKPEVLEAFESIRRNQKK